MAVSTTWPRPLRLRSSRAQDHAEGQHQPATGVIAEEVHRWDWGAAGGSDRGERAGQCDIVEIVPCLLRQRAVLSPARHPAIDEARICAHDRSPGKARAVPSRRGGTPRSGRPPGVMRSSAQATPSGAFQIEGEVAAVAAGDVVFGARARFRYRREPGRGDTDHLGTQISEQHPPSSARVRSRRIRRCAGRPEGPRAGPPPRTASVSSLMLRSPARRVPGIRDDRDGRWRSALAPARLLRARATAPRRIPSPRYPYRCAPG